MTSRLIDAEQKLADTLSVHFTSNESASGDDKDVTPLAPFEGSPDCPDCQGKGWVYDSIILTKVWCACRWPTLTYLRPIL